MQLHISPNRLVSDIQKEFNQEFPFLKLEFFSRKAFSSGDYQANQVVAATKKVGDIQQVVTDGEIDINGEMKVKELEDRLKDRFYLVARVFRKSGNLWLETSMTDSWTLNQQTHHGKELSVGSTPGLKNGRG